MVTWGANTVHNIGATTTAAAPGFSFGTPQPPSAPTTNTGGLFGGTTTTTTTPGLFGSAAAPAPAPLFGSASFFGGAATPAPSSSGGLLFGQSSTSNNTSSIFGGGGGGMTTSSLFGGPPASTGGLFGSLAPPPQQQPPPPPPQIPAQAALQAHMNAYARNEEARVLQRMQTIHQTYSGTSIATSDGKSHCFSIALYNPITEQQRQLQDAVSSIIMTTNGGFMVSSTSQLVAPPRPAQMNDTDWTNACLRNPDPAHFGPVAVVGADALLARAIGHQGQSQTIQAHTSTIQDALDHLQQCHVQIARLLEYATEQHQKQCTRLLKLMKAVEVGRCFNIPLQAAEVEAFSRVRQLQRGLIEEELVPQVHQLTVSAAPSLSSSSSAPTNAAATLTTTTIPMEKQQIWMTILKEHRSQIGSMTKSLQTDQNDLQLLYDRVVIGKSDVTMTSRSRNNVNPIAVWKR